MKKLSLLFFTILITYSSLQEKNQEDLKAIKSNTFNYNLNAVNVNKQLEFHVELKYQSDSIHFEDFIIQGKKLQLEKEAIEGYQLVNQTIKLFDPSFDVQKLE